MMNGVKGWLKAIGNWLVIVLILVFALSASVGVTSALRGRGAEFAQAIIMFLMSGAILWIVFARANKGA